MSCLFGISVFNTIASHSHFSGASDIPLIEIKVVAATLSLARQVLQVMINHIIEDIQVRIVGLEKQVLALHKSNPVSQRLATIPGTGPIIATAIAATVADPNTFSSGREFAAWLGLVPRQNSTGGKTRLGGISKRGDSYLRPLLVNSAHTVLLFSKQAKTDPWLTSLLGRKPPRLVAAVALENKTARGLGPHEQTGHLPTGSSDSMTCRAAACRKLARVKTRDGKSVTRRIERNLTASAGFRSRPTDKASTRGIHQGQRSCKDRTERPDT